MGEDAYKPDFPSETIREGKVQVLVPKLEAYGVKPSDYAPSKAPVFYNPVMEFNRDLTVLAFQAYQRMVNREISICEPLTSQGIRGVRFAAEVEGVKKVLISDVNLSAFKLAKHNVRVNRLEKQVTVKHKDANCVLSCHASPRKRFDVIDVDPFGSPAPYIESAVRALRNGGLLASTATDMAPLCGVHPKACIRKYGGKPLRAEYCHELAVRLLAGCTASLAAKHDVGVRMVFSHSSMHYIRVYVQIAYGAKKADESVRNLGYILHCFNCLHRETKLQPFGSVQCPECGSKMDYAGPLWLGSIFDADFVELMMKEAKTVAFKNSARIAKLLALTRDEASAPITYYVLDKLSGKLGVPSPSNQAFANALRNSGYQAAPTHFNTRGIRTNALALTLDKLLREIISS
ncbi:MAG TPA: tRNA (guanine(10)-N(2))-dimethyltransferase [Candidatus Limnocylindrales bacterium]|nr:tRNA (guanine(10)-N(2))-dimethyltransferase [Candidatus Limnocylindrales bacterium]